MVFLKVLEQSMKIGKLGAATSKVGALSDGLMSMESVKVSAGLTNVRSREVMRSILRSTAAVVFARMSMEEDDEGSIESCKVPVCALETSHWM